MYLSIILFTFLLGFNAQYQEPIDIWKVQEKSTEVDSSNIKNNGETQFEHVVKKMVPSDIGTSMNSLVVNRGIATVRGKNWKNDGSFILPSMGTGKPVTYQNWNAGEPNNFQ